MSGCSRSRLTGISCGFLIPGLVNMALITAVNAEIVPVYELYLSTQTGEGYRRSKSDQFACDDTIYLFLESSDQALGDEILEVTWINTGSEVRHQTSNVFRRKAHGSRFWSWSGIAFSAADRGPFGAIVGFLDPVAGREKFIGPWKITATVSDRYEKKVDMTVFC